jgi:DNA-binding transcriptional LysR family regulator
MAVIELPQDGARPNLADGAFDFQNGCRRGTAWTTPTPSTRRAARCLAVEEDLRRGTLVELLPRTPPPSMPVSPLYSRTRQLSPRVRVFLDGAAREFAARSAPQHDVAHRGIT